MLPSSYSMWVLGSTSCIILLFLVDIHTGKLGIGYRDILEVLFSYKENDPLVSTIVVDIRLPTALLAIISGGALSIAGCQLQTVFNNNLASPYTLGLSSAAALGASIIILDLLPSFSMLGDAYMVSIASFLCCMLTAGLVSYMAKVLFSQPHSIILIGVAAKIFLDGLVQLCMFIGTDTQVSSMVFLSMGALSRATVAKAMTICLLTVLPVLFLFRYALYADVIKIGDVYAKSLGVCPKTYKERSIFCVCVLTASVVSVTGPIPFVGMMAPNIARLFSGFSHRRLLLSSMLIGILITQVTSILSQRISPGIHMPISLVLAVFGAPFFCFVTVRKKKRLC